MRKHWLYLFLTLGLGSCQALLQKALGIREPQPQTDAAVAAYTRSQYPDYQVYRVDSTAMPALRSSTYKPGWEPGFRPLQFICFSPDGKIVAQWASCEGQQARTFATFPPRSAFPSDTTKRFADFVKNIKPIRQAPTRPGLVPNRYTYLVYCTSWTPRLSRQLLRRVTDYALRHGGQQADVMLVSVDNY